MHVRIPSYPVEAAKRNSASILPYLNRPANIIGTFEYLEEELGTEGAQDVISKNPGVLSLSPAMARQTPIEDIVKAADNIARIESFTSQIPPSVKENLPKVGSVLIALLLYSRFQACADGACAA